jgi:CHAD domain-containing protein
LSSDAPATVRHHDGRAYRERALDELERGGHPAPPGILHISMRAPSIEVEWQFDALDLRPVQRWLAGRGVAAGPARVDRHRDLYLDTDDWRLQRAGYSLRIRRSGRAAEATLKSLSSSEDGLRRRLEVSEPASRAGDPSVLAGDVGARVRALAGTHDLRPVAEVRTVRQIVPLVLDGATEAELAMDDTMIPIREGPPARIRRVEVESLGEPSSAIRAFVRDLQVGCGLSPATLSKFESALLAIGAPAQLDLGPIEYGAGSSTGEVAFAVLRRQFEAFLRHEGGTRWGEDPEELHDMRVATRRLRAALSMFASALPVRTSRYREELGWVAAALGEVRDLDVQLEALPGLERTTTAAETGAFEPLREVIEGERQAARAALLQVLDSPRYDRMVGGFTTMLRHGPLRRSPPSNEPVLASAPDFVGVRYAKVRSAGRRVGPQASAEQFHGLRIRCKRLRYAVEFLEPVYGDPVRAFAADLVTLQDLLGSHQDAVVAGSRFRDMRDAYGHSIPPVTLFAMGAAAEEYARRARRLRRKAAKAFSKLGGKRWRALTRAMERRRPPGSTTPRGRPTPPAAVAASGASPPPSAMPA